MFNYSFSDFYLDETVKNDREIEMNNKGYKFITNFQGKKELIYRTASEIHNLKYIIDNEAYTGSGKLISDEYKAFYVDSSINDLSEFWRTFEELSK